MGVGIMEFGWDRLSGLEIGLFVWISMYGWRVPHSLNRGVPHGWGHAVAIPSPPPNSLLPSID